MKLYTLTENEAAMCGFTHVAHFKVTSGDLDTTAETADVIAVPIGATIGKVAFHVVTLWNKTVALAVGVAATGTSASTFLATSDIGNGAGTAAGNTFASTATALTVNNTASRFITATVTVTSGPATAGEGYLFFQLTDHAKIRQPMF